MDKYEQVEQLGRELDKVVERVRSEYDMSYEEVLGALQLVIARLSLEAIRKEDGDDDRPGYFAKD